MEKLKPINDEEIHHGCLTCSNVQKEANLLMRISVGFGSAFIQRNGKIFYDGEEECRNGIEPKRLWDIEEIAAQFPDDDWRLILYSPLHGETYQRQDGKWILVESNKGFA